jgi:excisionase family DNA binding protein
MGVDMERLLLKPSEAAEVLGIGRSLVYELIAQGVIPSVRLGRCIRVPRASLEKWINSQESVREKSGLAGSGSGGGVDRP